MAQSKTGLWRYVPFLIVAVIVVVGSRGGFAPIALVLAGGWALARVVSTGTPRAVAPPPRTPEVSTSAPPDGVPPETVARLRTIAKDMMLPGGRPREELLREASEIASDLPPHVRERMARAGIIPSGTDPRSVVPPAAMIDLPRAPVSPPPVRRAGGIAPNVLTGQEVVPPDSLAEGWYVTADGSRERWFNGASWTAHERAPGSG